MADKKITLTKSDRIKTFIRSYFLLSSFNYERMQNGGVAYTFIPAIKKLYSSKEDRAAALKRHLEFFNTHPFMANPIFGVTLALEEERANGANVDDAAISGVKVGMMGPLAGAGDPLFWFTLRPILLSLGASLAVSGNVLGPILFFVLWNVMAAVVKWYTQEFGYKAGTAITDDLSGNLLQQVTRGASMMGMFVIGALIERWVTITFTPVVSTVKQQPGAYIDWSKIPSGAKGIKEALIQYNLGNGKSLDINKVTTLQDNLDQLVPGLAALGLTFLCMYLLKKKVSPILIILGIFVVAIVAHVIGLI
ncbi:mannose-specific phosphotransferase system component IID high [Streptococcus criceti]|uniref:PTS system, mannose/fructose/sorbose family, IID component n=1 Tax=Streptococcus criceti HS-6 TaxID=873449 RepID=G5JMV5_STRCG|nr:PTS system mannose/fructose/sorbose family transporter subunit IID [Streptococcus criceti]EHI75075.1 PTS system, mannose/fructose/sorbose family, IID component [Streptococcus criceti HS-6]SUN41585.1 mannose-specific phosphotransferase system component IID high [Streptococcus criceti]